MARTGVELWLFAFEQRKMADVIQVRTEITAKLQNIAKRSNLMRVVWSKTKDILHTCEASHAVEEMLR